METIYEVYVSDTIHGTSDKRAYKTRSTAEARYERLTRSLRRNGHNTVVLSSRSGDGVRQIYPAPILGC